MNSSARSSKFYAVGGPVQPDRPCYVERDVDELLLRRLLDADYCHVMAPRHTGKTSLAAHTAWSLRDQDVRVAVIDLTQLLRNEQDDSAGRWYYSIAYRIVRDLRIKSDMQGWWADHSGLTNQQRLVEFFFEVVLASSENRYVVFVDRLEAMVGHPLAQEFLNVIRSCYDMRSTEPEFQRLTFCMLGSGTPDELVKNVQDSPFGVSVPVALDDFRRNELSSLLEGLGSDGVQSEQIISRVWWWTRGHPYLTQKIFRGLSRRQDEVLSGETVDEIVTILFLTSATAAEEAHLSTIAERLTKQDSTRVARLSLYGRIRKGGEVAYVRSSKPQRQLLASGVVVQDAAGMLVVRNNVYAEVFSARWVNQNLPFGWKRLGVAAATLLLLVSLPVWYTEYLPRPYERALTSATQDYQVAYEAYESLRFLPGYTSHADGLFSDFLSRQSRRAETLVDALRTYDRMLQVPGAEAAARELLAEFWDRHSIALALRGERDGALLAQLNALEIPLEERRKNAAGLVGDDYRQLIGTIRVGGFLKSVRADTETSQLTVLDDQHLVQIWQLNGNQAPVQSGVLELAAEERLQMQSRLVVSAPPNVKNMVVVVNTDHPRTSDVQISLRAPSGGIARLSLADARLNNGDYLFDAQRFPSLMTLLADDASGTWSASFSDSERGVTGRLLGWNIRIDQAITEQVGDTAVAALIPEPVLTTLIRSTLSPSGKTALVWPDDEGVSGDLLVWDLPSAGVLSRIPREDGFVTGLYVLDGRAIMTVGNRQLQIWDIATGSKLGAIALTLPGAAPQAISEDGRYLVLDVDREDDSRGYQTWDLETQQPVGEIVSAENSGSVAVDSQGRYLAIADKDRLVRVWSLRDATLFREFRQSNPARHIAFDPQGAWLISQDSIHTLRVWAVEGNNNFPLLERNGNEYWQYSFSQSGEQMFVGSGGRSYDLVSLAAGRVVGQSLRHPTFISDDSYLALPEPIVVDSQNIALTHDGKHEVKLWQLSAQSAAVAAEQLSAAPVSRSSLSVAGDRIALGMADGGVRVFPFDSDPGLIISVGGGPLSSGHVSDVSALEFDASGELLASGSVSGAIKIWDTSTGVPLAFDARHQDGAILDMTFSALSNALISASRELIVVTDVLSGERLAEQRFQGTNPHLSAVGSGDSVLVSGVQAGVALWNWRDGSFETLVTPDNRIRHAVLAADDQLLVTADENNRLRLWNVETREVIGEAAMLPGPADALWGFSEPNQIVVRSGHWLQTYSLRLTGLVAEASVLLPEATAVVQPNGANSLAKVLVQVGSSRPMVKSISLGASLYPPLSGDTEALLKEWRDRLAYDDVFAEEAGGL